MGPTADGVNSQAESTAQAVKSQAAPAAEAVKSQAQSLAPSSAESVSQGLQPPAPSGNAIDSAKAAGEHLQNQLKSSRDLPSIGNVRFRASLHDQACKMSCHNCQFVQHSLCGPGTIFTANLIAAVITVTAAAAAVAATAAAAAVMVAAAAPATVVAAVVGAVVAAVVVAAAGMNTLLLLFSDLQGISVLHDVLICHPKNISIGPRRLWIAQQPPDSVPAYSSDSLA